MCYVIITIKIYGSKIVFDVFFLSYGEPNAEINWSILRKAVPYAKRVDGIEGIHFAHQVASQQSNTPMFYVVDADNEVLPDFDWSFKPHSSEYVYTHIWRARNAVNKLVYGHGGIKLFLKDAVLATAATMPVDFSQSVSSVKIMSQIGSIDRFNSDPYHAWKGAFRECVKLSQQDTRESKHRLQIWSTFGADAPYGDEALRGAKEGRLWGGAEYHGRTNDVNCINDPVWLKDFYARRYIEEF